MLFPNSLKHFEHFRIAWYAVGAALVFFPALDPVRGENSDFIIQSWHDHEGLPESSRWRWPRRRMVIFGCVFNEGLLRFDGIEFLRAEKFSDLIRLAGVVAFLETDRSGAALGQWGRPAGLL